MVEIKLTRDDFVLGEKAGRVLDFTDIDAKSL